MGQHLEQLRQRLADVHTLSRANAVLDWDQQTYMPPRGSAARAEHMATLARLAHEIFTAPQTGDLLQSASMEVTDDPEHSDDVALLRVVGRDYDLACKTPPSLVAEMRRHAALAKPVWVQAQKDNDFAAFAPYLQRSVELSRELADDLGFEDHRYDALLDEYEPGMKTAQVQQIFQTLKDELVPLVRAIRDRLHRVDDSVLHQPWDEVKQERFGRMVVERFGYDFTRGRQDRTVHPFEITFSRDDVRITTRFEGDFLNAALFGTMHEAGHAMYEQGIAPSLDGTMLGQGVSLGLHESQSRMWENVIGRSRRFWQYFYPLLQDTFPEQLSGVDAESFYRAINKVQPSLIRVEADEVTYNLHIMLRFEMEVDLLEDRYPISEAPHVWNDKMEDYLGIRPPTDTLGILQDIHWTGTLGYFPTYTLGNILSIQLYDSALTDVPEIPDQIGQGNFAPLREWLTEHVYQHGRKYQPNDLVRCATGESIQSRSYMRYLHSKYGEIYGL